MKKYYLLYCTVLYCSIDVLGCDCCRKLCVKSGEGGVKEEKSKWLSIDPKTGEENIDFNFSLSWGFFRDSPEVRKNKWSEALKKANLEDVSAVPVLFKASCNDKNVFWFYDMPDKAYAYGFLFAFPKDSTFDDILKYLQTNDTIKSIVLSCEGGNEKILYDGSQQEVADRKIVDVFPEFKNSKDPLLKRVVCLSFTYDVVKKDV